MEGQNHIVTFFIGQHAMWGGEEGSFDKFI